MKYTKKPQQTKKNDKDVVDPWVPEEEITLCKAWVDVTENNVEVNARKAKAFWTQVHEYFVNEMNEKKRSYDYCNYKWKNRLCPKVSQLSDVQFREIEVQECCKSGGSKKLRTSKTTSHGTSRLTHIGLDLNDKVADSKDEEVQEVRPIGWDKLKKKASSSAALSKSSVVGDQILVDTRNKEERMEQVRLTQHRELEAKRIAHVRQQFEFERERYREVPVNETFHEQTDDELTEKELKQVEADDQAIQTILLGLPEDIYAI
ncbi:hypothetical protein Tco_0954628 [Tanacetum coccineum]|uniref:Myb-like domain-containing protein n=1 Tax=Tanacetum coccineum TaxID=301880 RepID=A0ABQ5E4Y1_9ASTR